MNVLADAFFRAWLLMTLLTTGVIAAIAIWALRAGQFSRQDHARHLPLQAGIPYDDRPAGEPAPGDAGAGARAKAKGDGAEDSGKGPGNA